MKRRTADEKLLEACEQGALTSDSPSKSAMRKYKDAARATLLKDRRVNVRLSTPDLMDIQARAAEEGVPYQTSIASVLHKYVSGRLRESPSRMTSRARSRAPATTSRASSSRAATR
jgi:predicted DNA binding CopG/RHH family protein